jgi:hypothetical protein
MGSLQPSPTDVLDVLRSLPPWVAQALESAGTVDDLHRLGELHPPLGPALRHVQDAVQQFVARRHAPRAVIEARPELLTTAADTILRLWGESLADHGEKVTLWAGQALLQRCREEGVEATFGHS